MLQKDLAKVLGVTDNTISYYCKGVRAPQLEQLPRIAEALNTTTDYLLGRTEIQSPDISIQAIAALTGLSEDNILSLQQNHASDDPLSVYQDCANDFLDAMRSGDDSILNHYLLLRSYAYEAENFDSNFYNEDLEKAHEDLKAHGFAVIPSAIAMRFSCSKVAEAIEKYLFSKHF
jgi:transcriptional regulator with XRE-family HTH domain